MSVYTEDPPKFRWISGNQQYLDCDTKIPKTGFGYFLKTFLPVYLRRLLVFYGTEYSGGGKRMQFSTVKYKCHLDFYISNEMSHCPVIIRLIMKCDTC